MDFTKELGNGDTNFIKIASGASITGLLTGDVRTFHQHTINKSFFPCMGNTCQYCQQGDKKQFKFKINILVTENGAMIAKIFQGGWKVYQQLGALQKNGFDLTQIPVVIQRQGTGMATVYTVMPSPKGAINPKALEQMRDVKLLALEKEVEQTPRTVTSLHDQSDSFEDGEEIPF